MFTRAQQFTSPKAFRQTANLVLPLEDGPERLPMYQEIQRLHVLRNHAKPMGINSFHKQFRLLLIQFRRRLDGHNYHHPHRRRNLLLLYRQRNPSTAPSMTSQDKQQVRCLSRRAKCWKSQRKRGMDGGLQKEMVRKDGSLRIILRRKCRHPNLHRQHHLRHPHFDPQQGVPLLLRISLLSI